MLDIRQLREDPEAIKTRLKARWGEAWILIDEILSCDEKRRAGREQRAVRHQVTDEGVALAMSVTAVRSVGVARHECFLRGGSGDPAERAGRVSG